jgi:outer membrane protein TolC
MSSARHEPRCPPTPLPDHRNFSNRLATLDQVAREVVEAHVQVTARQAQIAIAKDAVAAAIASRALNAERIQHAQGLPLEVLQSNQALAQAQREYLRTIVDYNVAQFSLYRALGWPKTLGVLPSVAPPATG